MSDLFRTSRHLRPTLRNFYSPPPSPEIAARIAAVCKYIQDFHHVRVLARHTIHRPAQGVPHSNLNASRPTLSRREGPDGSGRTSGAFSARGLPAFSRVAAAQREELEQEINALQAEAERVAEEARELAVSLCFE